MVGASDAAIQLSALEQFLQEERVTPQFRDQSMILSDGRNQEASSAFIVNILCQKEDLPHDNNLPQSPSHRDLNTYYQP